MKTLSRVVVFWLMTIVFSLVLVIVQEKTGIDPEKIVLPQMGPGLAAILVLLLFRRDGVRISIVSNRVSIRTYLVALFLPLAVSAVLYCLYTVFIEPVHISIGDIGSVVIMIAGMLAGAFTEELGWRGYLQNMLGQKTNAFYSAVSVGILWGLWHIGSYRNGPVYMSFFLLSTIGYSVVMAGMIRSSGYNVIVACLFHFAVNAGFYVLKDALDDTRIIAANAIVWIGIAIVIIVIKRKEFFALRTAGPLSSIRGKLP
jgi:membrane protease YdiL (CAAX protease family)